MLFISWTEAYFAVGPNCHITELVGCAKIEVDILGSPFLVHTVFVDVKQH